MSLELIIPAFIAGLLTFLAPCTLPLVPGYLGFISGVSAKDLQDPERAKQAKRRVLLNGIFYVLGFSLVFIFLGSVFGTAGSFLSSHRIWLSRIGGVFVIFFGLYLMHLFDWRLFRWLNQEKKFSVVRQLTPGKPSSSFIFGMTFAFGWTPCVGPILGTILLFASQAGTALQGIFLLTIFSLGLAVPFLLLAIGIGHATTTIKKLNRYLPAISFAGGIFLVFMGILLATDNMALWVTRVYQWFDFINASRLLDYL